MKKIGRGWQYAAYDLENGRVLKKALNWFQAFKAIWEDIYPFPHKNHLKISSWICASRRKLGISLKLIKERGVDYKLIGNPKFLNRFDYEQDKVFSFKEYLANCSVGEGRKVIDDFIIFTREFLDKYNLIDKSFNIANNHGIDRDGNIIMLDFGELFGEEPRIKEQIENHVWDKIYIIRHLPEGDIREYFISAMNKEFLK